MATVKLPREMCQAVSHFKAVRKQSNDLQRKIHDLHESILDDQEQHTAKMQAQHGDERPDDPNDHSSQFHLQEGEQGKLRRMYRDAIKSAENEENALVVLLAKIQDLIDKMDDKEKTRADKTRPSSTARKATNKKQKKAIGSTPGSSTAPTLDESAQQQQQQGESVVEAHGSSNSATPVAPSDSEAGKQPQQPQQAQQQKEESGAAGGQQQQQGRETPSADDTRKRQELEEQQQQQQQQKGDAQKMQQSSPTAVAATTASKTAVAGKVPASKGSTGSGRQQKNSQNQQKSAQQQPQPAVPAAPAAQAAARSPSPTVPTVPATPVVQQQSTQPKSGSKAYLGEAGEQELMRGDKVAARVSGAANEDESFWILASVVKELGNNRWEVEDEDPGDDNDPNPMRKHYKLPKNRVLRLPKDFATHKPYPKGSTVLAMFPDTTTFYPATVEKPCTANSQYYQLKFEDDDDGGRIPNRKVKFSFIVKQG